MVLWLAAGLQLLLGPAGAERVTRSATPCPAPVAENFSSARLQVFLTVNSRARSVTKTLQTRDICPSESLTVQCSALW